MNVNSYQIEDQKRKQETLTKEMQRCAEKIWNALARYVQFDEDAIFKDPNWPHLWDRKQ